MASTACCRNVDYLVASSEFPTAWTGIRRSVRGAGIDPERIRHAGGGDDARRARIAGLRRTASFIYSPAFVVNCVDTTGAGDVFHGAFCYAVLQGMPMAEALDFSNAMAALNCTALGARGGIGTLDDVRALIARAERRSHPEFAARARGSGRPLMLFLSATPSRATPSRL